MKRIESRENPHFKTCLKWASSPKERQKAGRILLEGPHLLEVWMGRTDFPGTAWTLVLAESAHLPTALRQIVAAEPTVEVLQMPDRLFQRLAETETPQGILACVPIPRPLAVMPSVVADTLVLDGIQDPGNIGTLLRTAAAAGFEQIVLSPHCASPWSGKSLRAGQGAQLLAHIYEQQNLVTFLQAFSGNVLGAVPASDTPLYAKGLPLESRPLAWVMGSEGQGVQPQVLAVCDHQVSIPMPGKTESLNVAAAAAICLFETARRRYQETP